jgi:NTE family protein
VPIALSPVTINNYGGKCNYTLPAMFRVFSDPATAPRPAARVVRHLSELRPYQDGVRRPYIHLVDGGLADNLGMRAVLETLEELEALHSMGLPTPLDRVRRVAVFVVNSLSTPENKWDESEDPPGDVTLLVKATGVPIDHYSYEAIELLRDTIARWQSMRRVRESAAFANNRDPAVAKILDTPDIEIYAIDVSFASLEDKAETRYLNQLPTSFSLSAEAVDRLRAGAGKAILASPDFQRLLKDSGATVIPPIDSLPAARPPDAVK